MFSVGLWVLTVLLWSHSLHSQHDVIVQDLCWRLGRRMSLRRRRQSTKVSTDIKKEKDYINPPFPSLYSAVPSLQVGFIPVFLFCAFLRVFVHPAVLHFLSYYSNSDFSFNQI